MSGSATPASFMFYPLPTIVSPKRNVRICLHLSIKTKKAFGQCQSQLLRSYKIKLFLIETAEEVSVVAGKEYHLVISAENYLIFY